MGGLSLFYFAYKIHFLYIREVFVKNNKYSSSSYLSNNPCIINVLISMFLDNSVKQLDEIKS